MAEFQLIDLSHHNSVSDFLAVKNAGIYGVILRAGYGREASQKDRKFDEFYTAAKAIPALPSSPKPTPGKPSPGWRTTAGAGVRWRRVVSPAGW